jgi:hypothetical protein
MPSQLDLQGPRCLFAKSRAGSNDCREGLVRPLSPNTDRPPSAQLAPVRSPGLILPTTIRLQPLLSQERNPWRSLILDCDLFLRHRTGRVARPSRTPSWSRRLHNRKPIRPATTHSARSSGRVALGRSGKRESCSWRPTEDIPGEAGRGAQPAEGHRPTRSETPNLAVEARESVRVEKSTIVEFVSCDVWR